MAVEYYQKKLQKSQATADYLRDEEEKQAKEQEELIDRYEHGILPAQTLLQRVAQETQTKIRVHIENIVQMALDAVFPDRYQFHIAFETKRGKTEARIYLEHDGHESDPMVSHGGGVVDILALALRISAYTLSNTQNVMVMDEPMKWVSRDLQESAAEIIVQLSHELELQFIINTHIPEIISVADKAFKTQIEDKRTKVTVEG